MSGRQAFSGKQKKEQLKAKRESKRENPRLFGQELVTVVHHDPTMGPALVNMNPLPETKKNPKKESEKLDGKRNPNR